MENAARQGHSAITRRAFVAGATAIAGAATALASTDHVQATEVTSADDGFSPIAPLAAPATWDDEADIVVIGTGGGLAATTFAAQSGASVITIEKLPEIGGNTKEASYMFCPGGSRFQNEQGVPFDPQATLNTYWPMYRYSADQNLMLAMINRGHVDIDWLEELGVEWDFDWTFTNRNGTGLCWKGADDDGLTIRMTKPICDLCYQKATEFGADIRLSTEMTGLVMEDGRATGVRVEDTNGERYIHANTGVILCAGSGEANRAFLEAYMPTFAKSCGASMTYPTNDGKVVRMGMGAGAQTRGWDSFAIFDGGPDWQDFGGSWCQSLYGGYPALLRSPWLRINEQGNRVGYMDNSGDNGEMAATFQGMLEMGQPGYRTYVIFGKGWEENVPAFHQSGCRRPQTPDMTNIERAPEAVAPHNWLDGANNAIEQGWIKQANTPEELAEQLGLNPELVANAVEGWNATCAAGEDPMGYAPEFLVPLEPPYYGAAVGAFSPACGFGLAVDESMRVMGKDGLPIEGLYAAFLTAGGAWGESGFGFASPLAVNHLSWWSGYVAAETALGLEPRA